MKKNNINLISILVTNFNKEKFIKKSIKSILDQSFKNYEIILFDDCSTDNSIAKIKNFKNIKLIRNNKKKFNSSPLNQMYGILCAFKKSKGNLICLLDSDDIFEKKKLKEVSDFFNRNKNIDLVANLPNNDSYFKLKRRTVSSFNWPSIFPTSCISFRRKFFNNFKKCMYIDKFNNLEIDARLIIYSYFFKNFDIIEKRLTKYTSDEEGISSKYKKFNIYWWFKRKEAFDYLSLVLVKRKLNFPKTLDYYFTNLVYFFLNLFKK